MTATPVPEIIHVVDDDPAIRDSLTWLLATSATPVRTYVSAEAFLAGRVEDLAGCAVVDMRMAALTGLDLLDALNQRGACLPVIMLTGHGDVPIAVQSLKKGAFDFMEKPFDPAELIDKVQLALAEGRRRLALAADLGETRRLLTSLSPRETEVLDRMLAGSLNKQIADDLGIAMRTVEVHRARILEKFGVRSAVELAQMVARIRG